MKLTLACLAVTAVIASASMRVQADEGPFEVRLRGLYLGPANNSDAYAPLAIPKDAIHIDHRWLPDLDFEYFVTPHWSGELVLTYPQRQTVTLEHSALGGPVAIGTFKHLPPTLTLKYGLMPEEKFRPYVGAGVNVTIIHDVELDVPQVGRLGLDHVSVGPAAQLGFDYQLSRRWFFNMDAKWLMLRSDVKLEGVKISEVHIDPYLIGVGIGYRFGT